MSNFEKKTAHNIIIKVSPFILSGKKYLIHAKQILSSGESSSVCKFYIIIALEWRFEMD